ncbi:MAG: DEAD/DEAH box helicase [Lactobacillus sp.]|jgi:ATP-dependent RNA helicase CshB|nr:DEAD/DEAH box helicase [Lactobacillus sp.]MCH3905972.1 DEAD/DEAH box helicase [Lactobacillus sp.]MCH3990454.1 DEAD/DEAH box helicase [Lactobacillus sp.]MCH4068831.1 DEAD/DEAH box helicase [Lactobacillus sp.]MCI1304456.1 DEAD/DEAH box helicase [Lactobacillus sp.]
MSTSIFTDEALKPALRQGLQKIGFKTPTPVQEKVIPLLLADQAVVVQAMTGSGKTHAYLVPIFNQLDENLHHVQAVITAPSRELVEQIYQVSRQLRDASGLQIQIEKLSGGNDRSRQEQKLARTNPQLVIATPGRLEDFATKKILNFEHVRFFVVDEADMTMDLGFLQTIDQIKQRLPKTSVFAAFSATIPVKLRNFLHKYIRDTSFVVIDNPAVIAPTIENDLVDVGAQDRQNLLYQLLTLGQPYLALIFANTKKTVDQLTEYLQKRGLKVAKIHGGITERERKRTLRQVELGQYQYVVATDLAARGIDLPGVSLVINYELPRDLEFVIHRIGRTGRNGLNGTAITLTTEEELPQIEQLISQGVKFNFMTLKNGALVARKPYQARQRRRPRRDNYNGQLNGFVKKQQRKRKPGYRRKIKQAVKRAKRRR